MSTRMPLGTFNANSIGSQFKREETLPSDLEAYKIGILGFQETRIDHQSEVQIGKYHLFTLPTGNPHHGIGFAIAPHLRENLRKCWAHSDRVGILQIQFSGAHRVNVITGYAPHSGYPTVDVDKFYEDLHDAFHSLPSRNTTFIIGDFNTKIGRRREGETYLGNWGRGQRNRNGHTLALFCEANQLFLTNTAFQKKAQHLTT
ncbi:hypothetical protein BBJ29_009620 [Phytophthora kernoviae]|nr:hypothetical protein BBJ29_009620 [Phytophthora kernoviae]